MVLVLIITAKPTKSLAATSQPISIVAKVDNQIITNIDLIDRYWLVLKMSKIQLSGPQERQIVISQILQKMIDEELQTKEAKALEIVADTEKLDQAIDEIAKNFYQTPAQLEKSLNQQSLSYESFLKQVQAQLLWSDVIKKSIANKVKVNQSEIDELLEFRKIKADVEKYFLAEIFIPFAYKNDSNTIDSKELANKLFNELKKGKNFNNIVKQFSRSPTAEFNGEIGWVGVGDVDNKVYQAVSKVKVGEISSPIQMEDGYYLFKVVNKRTFSTLTEQDLEQVRGIIFGKKLQLLSKSHLMDLRKSAYIEIDKEILLDIKI